jgi:hypothetical protein
MGFLSNLFGDKPLPPAPNLPFECVVVRGRDAMQTLESLRSRPERPVLLGAPADAERFNELLAESSESVEDIVAKALLTDVEEWMGIRAAEEAEFFNVPAGSWPFDAQVNPTEIAAHRDVLSGKSLDAVAIGLVPAAENWHIPAHVRYGGWNECPPPEIHLAMHRQWSSRWGSGIVCMTQDVIECTVERPPATREEAMALAREQFIYCPDIVHQGVETVEALAATLMKSRAWYFWWD